MVHSGCVVFKIHVSHGLQLYDIKELIVRNRKLQISKLSFEGCFVQLFN